MAKQTINNTGAAEIAAFLTGNLRAAIGEKELPDMVAARVKEAELQLLDGNSPTIEISALDSRSGAATSYTVSDEGVTTAADAPAATTTTAATQQG